MKRYQKCQNVHSALLDDVSGCEWVRKQHFLSQNTFFFSSVEVFLDNSLLRSFWRTLRCIVRVIYQRNMLSLSFLRKTRDGYTKHFNASCRYARILLVFLQFNKICPRVQNAKFTYYWDVQFFSRECAHTVKQIGIIQKVRERPDAELNANSTDTHTHTNTHLHTWYGTARRPHPPCLCTPVHIALCQTV